MRNALLAVWLLSTSIALGCGEEVLEKLGLAASPMPTYLKAEWKNWDLVKWESLAGSPLRLEVEEGTPAVTQSLIVFSDFAPKEKDLIRGILDLSKQRKFLQRNRAQYAGAHKKVAAIASILGKEVGEVQSIVDKIVNNPVVEVGAWVIETKSGNTATALFTDSESHAIRGETQTAALKGLMQSKGISNEEVATILYFHNHPALSPVSPADSRMILDLSNSYEQMGHPVEVYLYAICETDSRPIVFSTGFSPSAP